MINTDELPCSFVVTCALQAPKVTTITRKEFDCCSCSDVASCMPTVQFTHNCVEVVKWSEIRLTFIQDTRELR